MDKDEIIELIKIGEGITTEFKESISNKLGKEICAFANAQGGKIILGVRDSGDIIGIKATNNLKSQIQSYARNMDPLIMDLMLRVQKVEKVGSGIKRINDAMEDYGLNVKFESTGFFTVIFKRPVTPQATPQAGLTELESKIITEIKADPKISRNELAKKINISPDTIKEYLKKLKFKKVITRVGKTSAGHWEIVKK